MSHNLPTSTENLSFWLERQRYDRVIEEGRRLLASSPEDPYLHRVLAIAYWMLGDRRIAGQHFHEALRLNPDDESSLSLLALMKSSALASREADRHAIRALALDPYSLAAWHALATSSLADDREFSMRCVRRMLEIEPRSVEARMLMFAAISADDNVPGWRHEAERWLEDALQIEPENPHLHALLGEHLLSDAKRGREGEAHLRQAIAAAPMTEQTPHWRAALAGKRDVLLKLLILPRKICSGIITTLSRWLSRYPILYLLVKVYLIVVVACLMGLILWGIYLWPIVWLYRQYVIHGDHLRVRAIISGKRGLVWLVPAPAWLRQIVMLFALVAWWRLVPQIFSRISRLHPDLHSGNVFAIGIAAMLVAGVGLLGWLYFRKIRRRKQMAAFPSAL